MLASSTDFRTAWHGRLAHEYGRTTFGCGSDALCSAG